MKFTSIKTYLCTLALAKLILGCSVAQLEARLEANPQCKDVINPKTGALMPCPGSDKAFYREAGLVPPKSINTTGAQPISSKEPVGASAQAPAAVTGTSKAGSAQVDCKPQIHKKTGGTMPCPASD